MYKYKYGLLKQIATHIKHGGIIAYPTESCYGFGCDPFNQKTLRKIIQLKSRSNRKGMICIASKFKQLDRLINPISDEKLLKINQYWPGFYSLLLQANKKVPKLLLGQHECIVTRISTHNEVKQLCDYLNMALVSTSANKSGMKSIKSYRECVRQFGDMIMVLPGIIGFARNPSTIIDFTTMRKLR